MKSHPLAVSPTAALDALLEQFPSVAVSIDRSIAEAQQMLCNAALSVRRQAMPDLFRCTLLTDLTRREIGHGAFVEAGVRNSIVLHLGPQHHARVRVLKAANRSGLARLARSHSRRREVHQLQVPGLVTGDPATDALVLHLTWQIDDAGRLRMVLSLPRPGQTTRWSGDAEWTITIPDPMDALEHLNGPDFEVEFYEDDEDLEGYERLRDETEDGDDLA